VRQGECARAAEPYRRAFLLVWTAHLRTDSSAASICSPGLPPPAINKVSIARGGSAFSGLVTRATALLVWIVPPLAERI